MKLAIIAMDGLLELKNKGRLKMDVRGCKGCNAKEGRECWSSFLDKPTPIKKLNRCPDPIMDLLARILDSLDALVHEMDKLRKQ